MDKGCVTPLNHLLAREAGTVKEDPVFYAHAPILGAGGINHRMSLTVSMTSASVQPHLAKTAKRAEWRQMV